MGTRAKRGVGVAACIALGAIAATASQTQAAGLFLTQAYPDVQAGNLSVIYNNSTHALTISGFTNNLYSVLNGPANTILGNPSDNTFTITASIGNTGVPLSSTATFVEQGHVTLATNPLQQYANDPVSVTLSQFGFSSTQMDFLFTGSVGTFGTTVGVSVHSGLGVTFGFDGSMNSTLNKSDSFAVPEPASLGFLATGAVAMLIRRKRRPV